MQINEDSDNKLGRISSQDKYFETKKSSLEIERKKQFDFVESMTKKHVKSHKKTCL